MSIQLGLRAGNSMRNDSCQERTRELHLREESIENKRRKVKNGTSVFSSPRFGAQDASLFKCTKEIEFGCNFLWAILFCCWGWGSIMASPCGVWLAHIYRGISSFPIPEVHPNPNPRGTSCESGHIGLTQKCVWGNQNTGLWNRNYGRIFQFTSPPHQLSVYSGPHIKTQMKYHRWGSMNDRNGFSHSSGGWKAQDPGCNCFDLF